MIAENMLIHVKTLTKDNPVEHIIDLFKDELVHVAPILNSNNEVIGIVTKSDIYEFLSRPGHYQSCPIDWIMTKNPITADRSTSLKDLAMILRENHIFSLPIVEQKKLVGIVTIETILDYLLKNKRLGE